MQKLDSLTFHTPVSYSMRFVPFFRKIQSENFPFFRANGTNENQESRREELLNIVRIYNP